MNKTAGPPGSPGDSFIADEVGIETSIWGKYRLRSLYEPAFERRGKLLHRVAVEGVVVPYLNGQPLADPDALDACGLSAGRDVEQIRQLLHVRNHRNIGPPGLELFLDLWPWNWSSGAFGNIDDLIEQMHDSDLDRELVVCVLYSSDASEWIALIDKLRSNGFGIAIGDFGSGDWNEEQLDVIRPDIVRMDSRWFAQICGHEATARLFGAVATRLRERRARMLVKDIDTLGKFNVAYTAGVDLFQGPLLAGPALAGAEFDEAPLGVAEKLGDTALFVPVSR